MASSAALERGGVRPFQVDPDVMGRIRRMALADLGVVAPMHRRTMGTSLWGRLGEPFLEALYVGMLRRPELRAYVYEEDGRVRGFIAGATDASRLMRRTALRSGHALVRPALWGLLNQPRLLRPLLTTPAYFQRSDPAGDVRAESLFCSVDGDLRGRRVAGHLNKVLFDGLAADGVGHVKITTETDNEGANRQLRSWGFEDRGTFRFYGKEMVTYVLDLAASTRVEPRHWVG